MIRTTYKLSFRPWLGRLAETHYLLMLGPRLHQYPRSLKNQLPVHFLNRETQIGHIAVASTQFHQHENHSWRCHLSRNLARGMVRPRPTGPSFAGRPKTVMRSAPAAASPSDYP